MHPEKVSSAPNAVITSAGVDVDRDLELDLMFLQPSGMSSMVAFLVGIEPVQHPGNYSFVNEHNNQAVNSHISPA